MCCYEELHVVVVGQAVYLLVEEAQIYRGQQKQVQRQQNAA